MTQRKIALSIEEAADYTGIGRNTLRQLVAVSYTHLDVYKRQDIAVFIDLDIVHKFNQDFTVEGFNVLILHKGYQCRICLLYTSNELCIFSCTIEL